MKNNTIKSFFSAVLVVAALAAGQNAWAQDPASIGSISYNPILGAYEINCANNLHDLAVYVNGAGDYTTSGSETTPHKCEGLTFKMTADIDIPHNTDWNDANSTETNYTAIGVGNNWFSGTFDGQHHTVSGIRIYYTDNNVIRMGLFGVIRGGSIVKDVNISGIRIRGYNSIGAVVGMVWPNSTVSGCSVTDAFLAGGSYYSGYLGGIVGSASGSSTISDCHVSATVTVHAVVTSNQHGGIAGSLSTSSIIGCTSSATLTIADAVDGCKYFGGIVGYISGTSVIQDCRAIGVTVPATTESSDETSGAIIGYITSTASVTPTDNYYLNCNIAGVANAVNIGIGFNAGSTSDHTGGTHSLHTVTLEGGMFVSGPNEIIGSVTYYPSGKEMTLGGGTGYTVTVDGSNPVTYVQVNEAAGVYTFMMPSGNITVTGSPDFAGLWHADGDHDGTTAERAYIITSTDGLNLLASLVNLGNTYSGTYFKLDSDISYNHTTDWDDASSTENNFVAIGNPSDGNNTKFSGIFDGCNHTISGIRIYKGGNSSTDSHQGLFGSILNATVKNVTLTDTRITGKQNVGGIAGTNQSSDIDNCHVSATVALNAVMDDSQFHGGIVGTNWKYSGSVNARVLNCTSSARLTKSGNPSNCGFWGGIVGVNNGAGAVITDCFSGGVYIDYWGHCGAIAGSNDEVFGSTSGTLSYNYYNGCTVTSHTSNIGLGITGNAQDVTENNGARGIGKITLDESVSAVGTTVTVNASEWYYAGQSITLGHGAAPMGYSLDGFTVTCDGIYPVETEDITKNAGIYSFTMPARNVTASLTWKADAELVITSISATLFGEAQYVTTFYHGTLDYQLPEGAKAYTASLDDSKVVFHLIGADGSVIPKNTAAIVVANADNITLTKLDSTEVTAHAGNILQGKDTAIDKPAGTVYVLGSAGEPAVLGFYTFNGPTIPAHKAYYVE